MKVLVIVGSPRKGNTYRAAIAIQEAMKEWGDVTFEYLMLRDMDIGRCLGCFTCFTRGEEYCPNKDDAPAIEAMMHAADGVIFASPVYGMNVSGLFKTFVDRFSYIFHRPRFFGKKALLLTTAGALGNKEVLRYLDLVARIWGFEVVERVGLVIPFEDLPETTRNEHARRLREASRRFYTALTEGKRYSPGFSDVLVFNAQRSSFIELKEESPMDYQYWKEQGWFDKGRKYYTDVSVNPVYNAIGKAAGWYIRRNVRKQKVEQW